MIDILDMIENGYKQGYDIKISVSDGEENNKRTQGNTLYIKVKEDLYTQAITKLAQLKMEDKQIEEDNEVMSLVNNRYRSQNGKISSNIKQAKQYSTESYLKEVENNERSQRKNNEKNKKREIKGYKKIGKIVKYVVVALLVVSAADTAKEHVEKNIEEYKDEAATRILDTVKEELGADAIYDKSTLTSSNSGITEYEVVKDGKSYKFVSELQDGDRTVVRQNELDEQTREAIKIAANAQNGNVFDAMKANKFADKIENGDINLTVNERETKNTDDFER